MNRSLFLTLLLFITSIKSNGQCDNLIGININSTCYELTDISSLSIYTYQLENPSKDYINIDLKQEVNRDFLENLGFDKIILGFKNQKESINIKRISPEYIKAIRIFKSENEFSPDAYLMFNRVKKDLTSKYGNSNENIIGKFANTESWHFEGCTLYLSLDKEKRMILLMHIKK